MALIPPDGARCVNAVIRNRSNLLRLEHELQTAVDGGETPP
jgi:hypothetical protein